jgi:hydrogenase maturation protease
MNRMENHPEILIYGYGNPGRQDDGLAAQLIQKSESWIDQNQINHVTFDANYQLQVEDITLMHDKDLVIFVDASMEEHINDFAFSEIEPDSQATFSMHAVAPAYLLDLCQKIYGKHPPAFMLHVRGYEWKLNEGITERASKNLEKAWAALQYIIKDPEALLNRKVPLQPEY